MPAKPKKKRPGRPSMEPGQKAKIVSTSLPPNVVAYLTELGNGSESRGLRIVAVEATEKNLPNN